MGCFFGCFRVRDDRRPPIHLLSQPISSIPKDPVESVARKPLSSLLLFEAEDGDQSPCKDRKCSVPGSVDPDTSLNELKAEAKFLKACGTLPQTPAEFRKKEKLTDSEPHSEDKESSTFHSWLQNASIEKLKPEKQPDQQPSPVNLFEEWENGSDSSSHSLHSCLTGQDSERLYFSSAEGCGVKSDVETVDMHSIPSTQCRNKSVKFDYENDASSFSLTSTSSEVTCQELKPAGLSGDKSVSKSSPYPTPLTLSNDMQTPGTVFPAHLHNMEIRKNPRIRSQYVYQVAKPVENAAQLKAMMKESYNSDDYSAQLEDHLEKEENTTGKEVTVDTSLSSWLPPKQAQQGCNNRSFIGRTPGDRPILGMVAAHWNADETVSSPTKWWDGNGIPNSTNKYKEDQKVSWHATPFEERLEKALSEDKLIAERKQLGKVTPPPIDLEEKAERATSSHFESGYILINSS